VPLLLGDTGLPLMRRVLRGVNVVTGAIALTVVVAATSVVSLVTLVVAWRAFVEGVLEDGLPVALAASERLRAPLVDSPARMANIKSQKKRNLQNERRRQRNIAVKSALRTSTKKVHAAAADGDADSAASLQREAARALDKAGSKGVLHKRTVARKKSRLAKAANRAAAAS
jgi:small subunit ribosomal protein S20